jgi:predicted amidohydrolase YtcJ
LVIGTMHIPPARETPVRELLAHKLVVISGSDVHSDTPDSSTLNNPFIRLHFFVTRKNVKDELIDPEERVSRADALRFATINSAYANFEEKTKGSIEPGKLADFVILSADYLSVPEDDILKIYPLATYVGGREVYTKAGLRPDP